MRIIKYLVLALLTGFASVEAAAQSALPRKDIPAIAKAANGAIVTIVAAADGKPIAQGTGFLVGADGAVVTNYHVIEAGNVAVVRFPDGTALPVDGVLAADKARDLAVIKIHGRAFRTLALGDSDAVQVGEEVVAIGNPLSLESTVSNGIISGVRTSKELGGKLLQTTAPISPGSSGGPLFNMRGEVVGVNTLYLKVGENLNFAVPVNDAKPLLSRRPAKLQSLPNEATAQAPDADAQGRGTMSQQKTCSEQAKGVFEARKNRWESSYRSHYNPAMGACLIETIRYPESDYWVDPRILLAVRSLTVTDAFDGTGYAYFHEMLVKGEKSSLLSLCEVQVPGQSKITCKSQDEFDNLTLKYLGITSQ